jgi:hypothetical protein
MFRPAHVIAGLHECWRQLAGIEIRLGAQQRKVEIGDLDTPHLVPRRYRTLGIGISHRVEQVMTCRIRMALNDGNTFRHSTRSCMLRRSYW